MKEIDREPVFVGKIVSALDKSVQALDPGTVSRLRDIRKRAQEAGRPGTRWRSWLPVAGIAAAAVALLAFIAYLALPMGVDHHNPVQDAEIMATIDNLEFYEDLDFYKWLTEEVQTTGKESWFRNDISLQYARNGSQQAPQGGVTIPGREERPIGRGQQSRSAV